MKKYGLTTFCLLVWMFIFGIPWWLAYENPPPSASDLERIEVTIIKISDHQPNIYARLNGGGNFSISFASPLYEIFSRKTTVNLLSDNEKKELTGCAAALSISKIRFAGISRVWAVDCGVHSISYERIKSHFMLANKHASIAPWVSAFVMGVFALLSLRRARRNP